MQNNDGLYNKFRNKNILFIEILIKLTHINFLAKQNN